MTDEKLSAIKEFIAAGEEVQAALDDLEAAKDRYVRTFDRLTKATAAVLVNVMGKTLAEGGDDGSKCGDVGADAVLRSVALHLSPRGAEQ